MHVSCWLWVELSVDTVVETCRECLYVFVPLLLPQTAGKVEKFSLFSSYLCCRRCVASFAVATRLFCVFLNCLANQEAKGQRDIFCNNSAVENHICPVKINAASLSKRIYLINHSGIGMNSLFTTNHFVLKKKKKKKRSILV